MDRIQAGFVLFHERNPHVYSILVEKARAYMRAGKRVGISHLWELLRWEIFLDTSQLKLKLPNNYRSRYARFIMEREDDLAGFFRTAELRCIDDGEQLLIKGIRGEEERKRGFGSRRARAGA